MNHYYKPLKVPPKKWRNSYSIQALAGYLRAEIERNERTFSNSVNCSIGLTQAKSILDVLCQAIHIERNHEQH